MATYAQATTERDRLMRYSRGLQARIRHVSGSNYELSARDARLEASKTGSFDESWTDTTRTATLTDFP